MKIVYPDYLEDFHCIADQCQHSCCIGWEIDIDEESLRKYQNLTGEFSQKIQQHIALEEPPHFILGAGERCPFLNQDNLCEMILQLGEDSLCQICTDHPRFRNFFSAYTEVGLGLCCEAAGQLILSQKHPFSLPPKEEGRLLPEEAFFFQLRDEVFSIVQNRCQSLSERIDMLCKRFSLSFPKKTYRQWASTFLSLEQLEETWSKRMLKLAKTEKITPLEDEWETPLEQLLCYFIYRHLAGGMIDGDYRERLLFSLLGTFVIHALASLTKSEQGTLSMRDFVEIARLYSSEIEYSEENTEMLLHLFREE